LKYEVFFIFYFLFILDFALHIIHFVLLLHLHLSLIDNIVSIAQCDVASIRLPTSKEQNQSKGYAFVEFSNNASLQKSLKLHETKLLGRAINIELTVGGGGNKAQNRQEKLKLKNAKLMEERVCNPFCFYFFSL